MASCMGKAADWVVEIPVVQEARRLPALGKKHRKVEEIICPKSSSILLPEAL